MKSTGGHSVTLGRDSVWPLYRAEARASYCPACSLFRVVRPELVGTCPAFLPIGGNEGPDCGPRLAQGRRRGLLLAVCLLLLLPVFETLPWVGAARAQTGQRAVPPSLSCETMRLESSSLEVDAETWQARAHGDVELSCEGVSLKADEAFVDVQNERSQATGDVRLTHGQDTLTCDSLSFNWQDQTGQVENGSLFIADTGYSIHSELLKKTGVDLYSLEGATFTTCRCPSPDARLPWEIETRHADIEFGGYAKIRRATFRLFRFPVLPLPAAYLPVKIHRESGLLVPRFSQSGRSGWGFALPLYWAVNASLDTTLTVEGLTKRGVKPALEVRYRPNKLTWGEWRFSGLDDFKEERGRYGGTVQHDQQISRRFYDKFDASIVSDNEYLQDFPGEVGRPSDRLLVSRGAVGFRYHDLHSTVEAVYSDLVEGPGGMEIAQKGPEVNLDVVRSPLGIPGLSASWRSAAGYYFNEDGEERGRAEYFPGAFAAYSPLPGLGLQAYGGVREVLSWGEMELYNLPTPADLSLETAGTLHRTLAQAGGGVDVRLGRAYPWKASRLYHLLKPRMEVQWVREIAGEPFPVVMDGLDNLERRLWLTYSVTNTLWGQGPEGRETGSSGVLAEIYLAQSVDLDLQDREVGEARRLSDLKVFSRFYPKPYLGLHLNVQVDPYEPELRYLETGVTVWNRKREYGISAGYLNHLPYRVDPWTRVELVDVYDLDYDFPGIEDTLRTALELRRPFHGISALLETLCLLDNSGKVENHLSVKYTSRCECWSVVLRLRQTVRPDDLGFSVRFQLEGLGS